MRADAFRVYSLEDPPIGPEYQCTLQHAMAIVGTEASRPSNVRAPRKILHLELPSEDPLEIEAQLTCRCMSLRPRGADERRSTL